MGNTLGALVFLGFGAWLGWQVYRGRAQNLLGAIAQPTSSGTGGGGGGGGAGAPSPSTVHGGPLQGVPFSQAPPNPIDAVPIPNVFGDIFGQSGPLYGPQYGGPYGVYSPNYSGAFVPPTPNLGPSIFNSVFGY